MTRAWEYNLGANCFRPLACDDTYTLLTVNASKSDVKNYKLSLELLDFLPPLQHGV